MATCTNPSNSIDTGAGSVAGVRQPKPHRDRYRWGFGLCGAKDMARPEISALADKSGKVGAVIAGNYASTTATTTQAKAPTLQDIERVAKILEAMPPEPIGEWMRQQGRPPEQWRVVLPTSLPDERGPALWPDYVVFSSAIDRPLFVARPAREAMALQLRAVGR